MQTNRLKAQMSLEMIIGLLILLVVAAVVIRMFLSSMQPIEDLKKYKESSTEFKEFQIKCEGFCREYSASGNLAHAALFCSTRLLPARTQKLLSPGRVDVIESQEGFAFIEPWPVCEDAIFCFHFFDCGEYGWITWSDCREILCEYYGKRYNDSSVASQKVVEVMQDKAKYPWGSCELRGETWWSRYFGDAPCGR
ncbi:MAG: hypothetical protein QXQ40_02055 [Candidatus Aenigmatarchaeota archaeon]